MVFFYGIVNVAWAAWKLRDFPGPRVFPVVGSVWAIVPFGRAHEHTKDLHRVYGGRCRKMQNLWHPHLCVRRRVQDNSPSWREKLGLH